MIYGIDSKGYSRPWVRPIPVHRSEFRMHMVLAYEMCNPLTTFAGSTNATWIVWSFIKVITFGNTILKLHWIFCFHLIIQQQWEDSTFLISNTSKSPKQIYGFNRRHFCWILGPINRIDRLDRCGKSFLCSGSQRNCQRFVFRCGVCSVYAPKTDVMCDCWFVLHRACDNAISVVHSSPSTLVCKDRFPLKPFILRCTKPNRGVIRIGAPLSIFKCWSIWNSNVHVHINYRLSFIIHVERVSDWLHF